MRQTDCCLSIISIALISLGALSAETQTEKGPATEAGTSSKDLRNVQERVEPPRQEGGSHGHGGGGHDGNFDPSAFRRRAMERLRKRLGAASDDDWQKIEPAVQKVQQLRSSLSTRRRWGGGAKDPLTEKINKLLEAGIPSKAEKPSKDELKNLLQQYRDRRKKIQSQMVEAQEDLKSLLSPKQEAVLILEGYLK